MTLSRQRRTGITTTENVLGGITLAVGLLAIINALPWRRFLRPLERRAVFWTLAPVGLLFLVPTATGPGQDGTASTGMLQPEPFAGVGRAALLVIAIGIWLFARAIAPVFGGSDVPPLLR